MDAQQAYLFHQTPEELAKALIAKLPIQPTDWLYEPFKGEGAFFNNFPQANPKDWSEIKFGRDYKDYQLPYDWVITNPPFRLENPDGKRKNAFWQLLDYYSQKAEKGIAFLGNDVCLSTLTPKRMALLRQRGWNITKVVVCGIKKWRGRYFFVVFEKKDGCFDFVPGLF
jgi:hypothetical protein